MRASIRNIVLLSLSLALAAPAARAVSCTAAPDMSAGDRQALTTAASLLGTEAAAGDAHAVQTHSASFLANSFADLAATITGLGPNLKGATITVDNLYLLHAADLAATDEAQFFCNRTSSPLLVTVSLGQVPPAEYALALVHATGVDAPQQFAMVFQRTGNDWLLAGFFVRPLTVAHHGALWYWQQARDLKAKNAPLSAYLYYEVANYLARPAELFTSNNQEKLEHETSLVAPKDLATDKPMDLTGSHGEAFGITGLRIDTSLGAMDLRVDAKVPALGDPVASRSTALAVMGALLAKYPELRGNFHGLWLFATAANGQTYAIEQPMSALP